jgi:uncharacterized Tic20 family protein
MIGYALLCLIALFTVILGSIVCGVAVWGWKQEKKAALEKAAAQNIETVQA